MAGVPDEGGGVGAVAAADGDCGVTGWFWRWVLHLIAMIIARITAPASRNTAMAINAPGSPAFRYVASDKATADAAYSVHAACPEVGLFIWFGF